MPSTIARKRLGNPPDNALDREPHPELVESRYSEQSIADILANLEGLENLYRGRFAERQGTGVQLWVRWYSPDVDSRMLRAIAETRWAVEAMPEPLGVALANDSEAVEAAYEQMRELRNTIGVDVINALAGSVAFNDNDGD